MSSLVDVIVPGPWWNALTYEADRPLEPGVRVRVPVGRGTRVGFVLGPGRAGEGRALRRVADVLDEGRPVLDADLWDLALWMGRAFLCGAGLALKTICPPELLDGEGLPPPLEERGTPAFHEADYFDPRDGERRALYFRMIEGEGRALLLFPEARTARAFFSALPGPLRSEALLWPSTGGKKLWDAWRAARTGDVRVVVAPPGGVFAPLRPSRIIVDEEASPAYIFQRPPRVSARSLAGRRALALGAELALGGRVPSSKTFLRMAQTASCDVLPDRKKFVFADMRRSLKGQERGVEGALPLTVSLLERTRAELASGRHVLWMLDRRGEAAEVFCAECGHAVRCPRCGGVMRSEGGGSKLRCVRCGTRGALPSRCPDCHGELWSGRRPGLEALASMAGRLVRGCPVLLYEGRALKAEGPSLILGTRGALALCDAMDVGLAAWLDLDAELRRPEYGARFQAFSMVWEAYWRGADGGRTVLVQTRRDGVEWRDILTRGWGRFWRGELALRSELGLPPFALMIQIDLPPGPAGDREALVRALEDAGLFVMDPGEAGQPLWVNVRSVEPVARALSPRFEIGRSRSLFPVITVWAE